MYSDPASFLVRSVLTVSALVVCYVVDGKKDVISVCQDRLCSSALTYFFAVRSHRLLAESNLWSNASSDRLK